MELSLVFCIPAIARNDTKEEFLRSQNKDTLPQEDWGVRPFVAPLLSF